MALGLGIMATAVLELAEVPLESVVAVFLPLVGEVLDFAFDGIEFVVLPMLLAAWFLPRLVRRRPSE